MLPRNTIDIGWSDLAYGIGACFWPGSRAAAQRRVEARWSSAGDSLSCLSVRTGFDLLLEALALPPGSEILVSAVTIRDMIRIIRQHDLVPVPVDLDMETLAVNAESLRRAASARTRAILVAHLFGSHMSLAEVAAFARERGLLLIEDCAQAYAGNRYRGHPASDVVMFSFGPIKTSTALGGAVLRFKDCELRAKVATLHSRLPLQSRWQFLGRLCKYALLKGLTRPGLFDLIRIASKLVGKTHDEVISAAVRGFAGPDFFMRVRRQPCMPLFTLLERRLRRFDHSRLMRREQVAGAAIRLMPTLRRPGCKAAHHTYWLFPILSDCPDDLKQHLWRRGFDATRGASSLYVVDPPKARPELAATEAARIMAQLLYVPVFAGTTTHDLRRLAAALAEFDGARAQAWQPASVEAM